ncbi:hypothetical protein L5515_019590 [Caenorhabditis briggsae]|uniref:Uncharacterized protein n=1 Tax=Caenorhabditis briggsae TaxID=6238 RepID=A0AAE9JU97_CAEBR|nr:hypothetical protein L5515_019590 [Caenorhabditis briggsae]
MNFFSTFFKFGCVPKENSANYTVAYGPNDPTVAPRLFNSTLLGDPLLEETLRIPSDEDKFPTKEKIIEHAKRFIKARVRTLAYSDSNLKDMYEILESCMNERVAMHIWCISRTPRETRDAIEETLLPNYLKLLINPDWDVQWSMYKDLTDHAYFPQFYKCQLKSDFNYRQNSHEFFIRMNDFINYLLFHRKGEVTFCQMLHYMKDEFDGYVARDLLVLYYYHKTKRGSQRMEEYLMAKYQFIRYDKVLENFNSTHCMLEDTEVTKHPFYMEYFLAKKNVQTKYKFKFDPYHACYKQAADYWIHFRLTVRDGAEKLPEIVKEMYEYLEDNISSDRAYELFLISQFRMDMAKIRRMEAYLSEKYRSGLVTPTLPGVKAEYVANSDECTYFADHYANIDGIIKASRNCHSIYTWDMYDQVQKMLKHKRKALNQKLQKEPKPSKQLQHHDKLLHFLITRPNEERIRELYAMWSYRVPDWEDAFYGKYKTSIKMLKNFGTAKKVKMFK